MSFNQKRKLKRKQLDLVNIAPLIDIVFLLLIFFISTSKLSELTSGFSAKNLPRSQTVDKVTRHDTVLMIYKNRNMKIGEKIIRPSNLEKELASSLKKTRILVISAEKNLDVGYVVQVIGIAKKIGYKEIQLAAIKER